MKNLRLQASRIIHQVSDGKSLADILDKTLASLADPRDRAFVQALVYGVCRYYDRLDIVLSHLLQKPMKPKDVDVYALLLVGLYQLMEMRIPEYAAVTETVNATEALKKTWARGFVNAILREYIRQRESMDDVIKQDDEALYSHPAWWMKAMQSAWPAHWQTILEANNQHPPFVLRVNQRQISRAAYLQKLQTADITAHALTETQQGIILDQAHAATSLEGFAAGEISVQDGAAQLAAELLQLQNGMRVLDACSAPGGKLSHMLEIAELDVLAVEKEPARIERIQENLARLQLQATVICADVNKVNDWWDGKLFDRILLDAPCSASGVVRRHPDIKLLRQAADIPALARQQYEMLHALWPLLKQDGLLLYATCSVFPEENNQVIKRFLGAHQDAQDEALSIGIACDHGFQILPGMNTMDGFYYALLRKIA